MFYDRFKQLCDDRGVSCNKAALEIGLSNATPTKWLKTGATPNSKTLQKIADYFGVSIQSLLGQDEEKTPALTKKDERDIARDVENIMTRLADGDGLMFDGDPMSDEARESMLNAIRLGLEAAKIRNKARFTPTKFK
jgi:transcriptional regulator with XRE-family HTH domain